ncbi:Dihydrolipoyl dehydrogenase [uncultured Roseburia sp.]|uniref:Dihydrolipoyl dehydrogenase n=1 Tax=Brotonthovivens ammoniilytica TaxID=2981725 RepID=A0ABT2TJU5_9FIRM|nr:dihydrolipoyl dehydrogenase [Brotonthovivens ammoniilytica]MCU6762426.1 dihydrolipoyl dehydrogenase [Brotonthovivens ammoniilytica]SCI71308.1 Dihydrolipoyl dehydrogenase [uncultured Roseburia sp.]
MNNYQAAVIGGGPGGYIAAIRCAQQGLRTVLIEKEELGGTCLNRGCIPTKTLLYSSDLFYDIQNCKSLGIEIKGDIDFKYKKIAKRKDKVVKQLRSGVEALVTGHGVELVRGEAAFTGPHSLKAGEEEYTAEKIILASGSTPALIPIPGADHENVLNSDDVLGLEECPESVAIIGGGVIGVEFATLFANLGKKVTIIEMMPSILYGMDSDICSLMTTLLAEKNIDIHVNAAVCEIKNGSEVIFEKDSQLCQVSSEQVILAVGRKPNTASLNLKAAGVRCNEKGYIETDAHMQTNVPGIYAIGDITGTIQLAHTATAQGIIAAGHCAGLDRTMDYSAVPGCIYTTPEIASVGLTEEKASAAGEPVKTGYFDISGNGRCLAVNCSSGFVKIICHANTEQVIGCHIIAPHATEMIGEAALAIQNKLTITQLANTIHAHPTVSESIMEAAHDVHGMCCHKL